LAIAACALAFVPRPAAAELAGDGNYNLCHFLNPDHFQAFERLYEGLLPTISPQVAGLIDADGDLDYNDCDEFYVNHEADRDPPLRPGTKLAQLARELDRTPGRRPATLDFSNLNLEQFSWRDDSLEALISYHFAAGHIDRLRFSGNPLRPGDVDISELPEGLLLVFDGGTGTRVGFGSSGYTAPEGSRPLIEFEFASIPRGAGVDVGDEAIDVCLQITLEEHHQWRLRINASDRIRSVFGLVISLPDNHEIEPDYELDLLLDLIPGCLGTAPRPEIDDGDIDYSTLLVQDDDAPRHSLCQRHPVVRDQIESWLPRMRACEEVSIAQLAHVTEIDLSGREDVANISAADFSQLPQLRRLDLRDAGLTALPPALLGEIGPERTLVVDVRDNPGSEGEGFNLSNLPALWRQQIVPGVEVILDPDPRKVTGFDNPVYYADEGRPLAVGLQHQDREAAGVVARLLLKSENRGHGAEASDLPRPIDVDVPLGSARLVALDVPEERISDGDDEAFVLLMIDRSTPGFGRFTPIIDFVTVRIRDTVNYIAPEPSSSPEPAFGKIIVLDNLHLAIPGHDVLAHNVPTLNVQLPGGGSAIADFRAHFEGTGGLERWGYPISEILIVEPGALSQYYQRGVVDFHSVGAGWVVERRLAWDYFGGGLGGSTDQGVEYAPTNPHPGEVFEPWGRRVSNQAVDGTVTGFAEFFNRLRGVRSFGLPKSEARFDGQAGAVLAIGDTGFIRQYFQAAVFEFHPGTPDPVRLQLLGDDLRDAQFAGQSWRDLSAFLASAPLADGDAYEPTRVRPNRAA
jgi:hypothetical protein